MRTIDELPDGTLIRYWREQGWPAGTWLVFLIQGGKPSGKDSYIGKIERTKNSTWGVRWNKCTSRQDAAMDLLYEF